MIEMKDGALRLYGLIGGYFEGGVSSGEFAIALESAPSGPLTIYINSEGGEVYEGIAMYSQLKRRGGVKVVVDSLAASIASVIAMAADEIVMMPHSEMMVHNPWTIASGNASQLSWVVESLERLGENVAMIYAEKTGASREQMMDLMDGRNGHGTFLTASQAVEIGLADRVEGDHNGKMVAATEHQVVASACGFTKRIAASHSLRRSLLR